MENGLSCPNFDCVSVLGGGIYEGGAKKGGQRNRGGEIKFMGGTFTELPWS